MPQAKSETVAGRLKFSARAAGDLLAEWKALMPAQPGIEISVMQARSVIFGGKPWIFSLHDGDRLAGAAFGVLSRGRTRASLGITLTAQLPEEQVFWDGVLAFVSRHTITDFWIEYIGAPEPVMAVPRLAREIERFSNIKLYVLDLEDEGLFSGFSQNPKRNIKKARKAGVQMIDLPRPQALRAHFDLMDLSMARRAQRGEQIKKKTEDYVSALLATGAGRLYQAALEGQVVSSKLVFVLGDAAYYDSAGTSPQGMELGVSSFLMSEVIRLFKEEKLRIWNLDVASEHAVGLAQFKLGFGPQISLLERAYFSCATPYKRFRNAVGSVLRKF